MSRVLENTGGRSALVTAEQVDHITRSYTAIGYTGEEAATTAVLDYFTANSLLVIGSLVLDEISPEEHSIKDNSWLVSATWRPFRSKAETVATETLSEAEDFFDIGLSSERIYMPLGVQQVYKRILDDGKPPKIHLIGDQGDGKPPAGVELLVPEITFGGTRYIKQSAWTGSSRNTILRLIGKVNSTPFSDWDVGEVLCAGISGSRRGQDDIQLNFRFRVRENVTVVTDGFPDIDKLGWEYIWPRHALKYDGNSYEITNEILYLVTAEVFPATSFTAIE